MNYLHLSLRRVLEIEKTIIHKDYCLDYVHDIALLKLKEKVDLSTYTPACLAPANANYMGKNGFSLWLGPGKICSQMCPQAPFQPGFEGDNSNNPQQRRVQTTLWLCSMLFFDWNCRSVRLFNEGPTHKWYALRLQFRNWCLPRWQWGSTHGGWRRKTHIGRRRQLGIWLCLGQFSHAHLKLQLQIWSYMLIIDFQYYVLQENLPGVYTNVSAHREWIDANIQNNGGGNFCDS